jgi:hypothetical protein
MSVHFCLFLEGFYYLTSMGRSVSHHRSIKKPVKLSQRGLKPVTGIRYLFEGFYTNTRSEKVHGHHKEICQYV